MTKIIHSSTGMAKGCEIAEDIVVSMCCKVRKRQFGGWGDAIVYLLNKKVRKMLLLLPRLFSRIFSLKISQISSPHLSCSFLLFIPLLVTNMVSRQKNAGCQMQRCHAISRQGKLAEHSRPQRLSCLASSTPTVCMGGRTYTRT